MSILGFKMDMLAIEPDGLFLLLKVLGLINFLPSLSTLCSALPSSDMSAARHADVLFVKDRKDNDLATYCRAQNIYHNMFKDWTEIKATVEKLLKGEIKVEDISEQKK